GVRLLGGRGVHTRAHSATLWRVLQGCRRRRRPLALAALADPLVDGWHEPTFSSWRPSGLVDHRFLGAVRVSGLTCVPTGTRAASSAALAGLLGTIIQLAYCEHD